jgi:putative PEP-CTERM system TPR-repeat lipoprotein
MLFRMLWRVPVSRPEAVCTPALRAAPPAVSHGPLWLLALAVAALLAGCLRPGPEESLAQARQFQERDDWASAALAAKNHLADRPQSGVGRLLLARILLAAADLQGAATELERAAQFGAPADEVAAVQAELWLAQGRPSWVVERLRPPSSGTGPHVASLHTSLAAAHHALGAPDQADAALRSALAAAPGFGPAATLAQRLQAERGDVRGALASASARVAALPGDAAAWTLQGDLQALDPALRSQAVESYRRAIALRGRAAEAHRGLVITLLLLGEAEAARAAVADLRRRLPGLPAVDYLDGLAAFQAGDIARAQEMTERLGKEAEPTVATLMLSGLVQARLGNGEQAESLLARAAAAAPDLPEARHELAQQQLRLGRAQRALETIQPLLADGRDGLAWLIAGQARARLGDFRGADESFERARTLRPGDVTVSIAHARTQFARGRPDSALGVLQAAAQADRDRIQADVALVASHMMRGDRRAALAALDAASVKQPDSPLPDELRGRILLEGGDAAGARAAFERGLQRSPAALGALQALANLDLAEGRVADARRRYDSLLKQRPRSAALLLGVAEVALRAGSPVAEVTGWIDKAVQAEPGSLEAWRAALDLQRRLGDAHAFLLRAQAAQAALADRVPLLLALAEAQVATGALEQAAVTLHRAATLDPRSHEPLLRLAVVHGLSGKRTLARDPLERARALAPDDPTVLRALVALALAEPAPEQARTIARQAQQRLPRQPLGWELEGEIEAQLGNRVAAAAAYGKALERRPTPAAAVTLHRALLASDAAEARRFEARWRDAHPADAFFLAHLAETAQGAGRLAEAEAHYRSALAAQPDNPYVMNNLAELLLQRKDPGALALAESAARLAPQVPYVLDTLASAQAGAQRGELALQTQRRAVELAPADPRLRLHLGRLLIARGEAEAARRELGAALRPDAPPATRQEAQRLLSALDR